MRIWKRLVAWVERINSPWVEEDRHERFKPVEWTYFEKPYNMTGSFFSYVMAKKPYPNKVLKADLERYIGILGEIAAPKERALKAEYTGTHHTECDVKYFEYFKEPTPRLGALQDLYLYCGEGWAIAYFSYHELDQKPVGVRRLLKFAIKDPSVAVQFRLMMD